MFLEGKECFECKFAVFYILAGNIGNVDVPNFIRVAPYGDRNKFYKVTMLCESDDGS